MSNSHVLPAWQQGRHASILPGRKQTQDPETRWEASAIPSWLVAPQRAWIAPQTNHLQIHNCCRLNLLSGTREEATWVFHPPYLGPMPAAHWPSGSWASPMPFRVRDRTGTRHLRTSLSALPDQRTGASLLEMNVSVSWSIHSSKVVGRAVTQPAPLHLVPTSAPGHDARGAQSMSMFSPPSASAPAVGSLNHSFLAPWRSVQHRQRRVGGMRRGIVGHFIQRFLLDAGPADQSSSSQCKRRRGMHAEARVVSSHARLSAVQCGAGQAEIQSVGRSVSQLVRSGSPDEYGWLDEMGRDLMLRRHRPWADSVACTVVDDTVVSSHKPASGEERDQCN
ncbi:hypothetical protein CC78DRAFT_578147 [Lojkania enalia]|uniref:Uncharacterized protein n=1 Tax=Lojkania enalia TaxID=147567 RepID=A0A9P4KEY5_9PLEO|nr:hypothetical protein CC78DRAFT_578147 [Didymosphaeria enalia]